MTRPIKSFEDAYIAIGANLGDALSHVQQAILDLSSLPHTQCMQTSRLYQSPAFEAEGPDYINAVVWLRTRLEPYSLLSMLQDLEQKAGRVRPYKNAPRPLDLDILLYSNFVSQEGDLIIPHPRMWERAFVVLPLQDVAPQLVTTQALVNISSQPISVVSLN